MNTYYWRAIHRIAKRKGISIAKARKLDWRKEVRAEFKRRSKAAVQSRIYPVSHGKRVSSARPTRIRGKRVPRSITRRTTKPPVPPSRKPVSTRRVEPELKIRDYDRIHARTEEEEEEYEELAGDQDEREEWEQDWQEAYPELDELDDIQEFAEEFEERDDEKYKEPS